MSDLESSRREAIRLLCRAQAEDRLSVEAFQTRLEHVEHAPNQATLAAVVADLEDLPPPALTARYPVAPADHTDVVPAQPNFAVDPVSPAEYLRVSSVFASSKRAGAWTVPLEVDGMVFFGELSLDLRDAVFGSDVVDINVDVKVGSFELIVPAGTQVENEIEETLSSSSHSTRSARGARPNGLLVRLRGKAFLASIDVKEKFPTKPGKVANVLRRLLGAGDD
jgi:hypothetical protein